MLVIILLSAFLGKIIFYFVILKELDKHRGLDLIEWIDIFRYFELNSEYKKLIISRGKLPLFYWIQNMFDAIFLILFFLYVSRS